MTPETHDWHETTAVDAFIDAMYRDYDNPTKVEQDASTEAIRNHYDDRRPVYIARAIARLESEAAAADLDDVSDADRQFLLDHDVNPDHYDHVAIIYTNDGQPAVIVARILTPPR